MHTRPILVLGVVVAGLVAVASLMLAGDSLADYAAVAPAAPAAPAAPDAATSSYWSSGWITVTRGSVVTLTHNLGADPDDYLVQMWFYDADGGRGINVRGYGGMETGGQFYGAAWQNLTSDTIQIIRYANDTFADRILVRVWIPTTEFEYCSDWTSVAQGATQVFTHNLGSAPDDYSVGLAFRNSSIGINQRAYGGLEYYSQTNRFVGAYWSQLTTSTIQVYRHADDVFAGQMRVCVTHPDEPDYDSGWVTVTQGVPVTLTHDLGNPIGAYKVRLDQWLSAYGVNHRYFGGAVENVTAVGANWENLTTRTVQVYSRNSQRVRIRIWTTKRVYLPLVLNNYAPPTELSYDDGVSDSWQSFDSLESGFAVRFTPPGDSATLIQARYYLNTAASNHPIQVHVWDSNHDDLLTPFTVTPSPGIGWLDVDLSGYDLMVSGDFYVGFLYTVQHSDPSIGVDISAPDGRSYEVPWEAQGNDYMIRAVVR